MMIHMRWLSLLVLFIPFLAAQAEVYRWVDNHGRVHFEDRQPNKVAPRNVEEIKVRPINILEPVRPRPAQPSPVEDAQIEPVPSEPTNLIDKKVGVAASQAACAAQKRAYESSKACFLSCGMVVGGRGSVRINNSSCGQCTDVVMPHC